MTWSGWKSAQRNVDEAEETAKQKQKTKSVPGDYPC